MAKPLIRAAVLLRPRFKRLSGVVTQRPSLPSFHRARARRGSRSCSLRSHVTNSASSPSLCRWWLSSRCRCRSIVREELDDGIDRVASSLNLATKKELREMKRSLRRMEVELERAKR